MPIRWYGPSIVLLLTVVAVMVVGPQLARRIVWNHTDASIQQVRHELTEDANLADLSESFSKVSEVVEPSVVHVRTFGVSARSGGIFSRFDPPPQLGSGSGWVYRHQPSDGGKARSVILTNHHVVDGADEIHVRFADGSEHNATLINSDPPTDVAVLEVDDAYLHPAAVSLEPVRKGQIVFAFGSPFQFEFSVSQGIVSASGRRLDIANSNKYEDFIQTDAAINPGNSGGPLTDIYGRVVGMNTAIASTRNAGPGDPGGFMGLGFAIPVQMAIDVADRILDDGEVQRGYLGVYIHELSPELAESFGYDGKGVLIEHAVKNGPADQAGLLPGDIVTRVGEHAVEGVDDLRYRIAAFNPGQQVNVRVMRNGQPQTLTVELDLLPAGPTAVADRPRPMFVPGQTQQIPSLLSLGIQRVADFSETDARAEGYDPLSGVMIMDVRLGSVAASERLGPQAIITHVNDTPVLNLRQLAEALDSADPARPLRLTTVYWDFDLQDYVTRFALFPADRR